MSLIGADDLEMDAALMDAGARPHGGSVGVGDWFNMVEGKVEPGELGDWFIYIYIWFIQVNSGTIFLTI